VTGDKAVADNKALEAGVAIDGVLTSCTAASARRCDQPIFFLVSDRLSDMTA
jgi:hypothetical protein